MALPKGVRDRFVAGRIGICGLWWDDIPRTLPWVQVGTNPVGQPPVFGCQLTGKIGCTGKPGGNFAAPIVHLLALPKGVRDRFVAGRIGICGMTEVGSFMSKFAHPDSFLRFSPRRPFRFFEIWVSRGLALPSEEQALRDSFAVRWSRK